MSVAKVIEINAASTKSMEAAVQHGLHKAAESVQKIKGAWVNKQLRGYQPLWRKFDSLIVLQAPSWEIVRRWRGEQEQDLIARHAPLAMDEKTLERFLLHFERLSRHALVTLPALADTCVEYDDDRHVTGLTHV